MAMGDKASRDAAAELRESFANRRPNTMARVADVTGVEGSDITANLVTWLRDHAFVGDNLARENGEVFENLLTAIGYREYDYNYNEQG